MYTAEIPAFALTNGIHTDYNKLSDGKSGKSLGKANFIPARGRQIASVHVKWIIWHS